MMRLIFFLITICLVDPCFAQMEAEAAMDAEPQLCRPGILHKSRSRGLEVSYTQLAGAPIRFDSGEGFAPKKLDKVQSMSFKLKVPLVNRPDLKMLLGFAHQPETIFYSATSDLESSSVFNDLNASQLKRSVIGFYLIKVVDDDTYTGFTVKLNQSGDYAQLINFGKEYRGINANWVRAYKKSEDFEWGYGIALTSNFRRTLALPFIIYNRNFNPEWGIESIFPAYVNMRYNVSPKTILLGGYQYNSRNYAIDKARNSSPEPVDYHINHAEIQFGFTLEQQIVPWVWFDVKAGYQYNFATRLDSQSPEFSSFRVRPGHRPYFGLSLFLSPPSH